MGVSITIVGAGGFGTALAAVLATPGSNTVTLLGRDPGLMSRLGDTLLHSRALPEIYLPEAIRFSSHLESLRTADIVLFAVPAQAHLEAAKTYKRHIREDTIVVTCAKGIDRRTKSVLTDVLRAQMPRNQLAAVSGPGFSIDLAKGLPTAMVVAAATPSVAEGLATTLSTKTFRLYASSDEVGVQLGGSIKNVLAIGCGIVEGAQLGDSARAALISRGLAEMSRLVVAMGGNKETARGLSGLGDLVLTGTSVRSRNYRFGLELGKGMIPSQDFGPLVEGASTAPVAARLGRDNNVELPIVACVADILTGKADVKTACTLLMSRPVTKE